MSLRDNLTCTVPLSPIYLTSPSPDPSLRDFDTTPLPCKSFQRTNPKWILTCQKNSLCAARWERCTVTLCCPPALFSPVSASPITQSHTNTVKHMTFRLRCTQACTAIDPLLWARVLSMMVWTAEWLWCPDVLSWMAAQRQEKRERLMRLA